MQINYPSDPKLKAKMLMAMAILSDAVSLVDAMGFDAHVYYDKGKRFADIVAHDKDLGDEPMVVQAVALSHKLENFLHIAGWHDPRRN